MNVGRSLYERCGFHLAIRRVHIAAKTVEIDERNGIESRLLHTYTHTHAITVLSLRRCLHVDGLNGERHTNFSTFAKRKLLIKLRNQINGTMLLCFANETKRTKAKERGRERWTEKPCNLFEYGKTTMTSKVQRARN